MDQLRIDQRGISPVVGTAILLAMIALLVGVSTVMFISLTEEREPKPDVVLEMETSEGGIDYRLVHEGGDSLDGDKVQLRGAADDRPIDQAVLTTGETSRFVAVENEIQVIYHGDHGTTYKLTTFEAKRTVPEPDEGCDWVDAETSGGTDPIQIDGIVVNCDVETKEGIEVQNGGTVIGETVSDAKDLDGDNAVIVGDADVETVVNLQDGSIAGSATSRTADVKLDNATVSGDAIGEKVVEVATGSNVDGNIQSHMKDVKVLSSSVSGSITAGGEVKLQDATVDGDVYTTESNFDCSNTTINGQDCSDYIPKQPGDWEG